MHMPIERPQRPHHQHGRAQELLEIIIVPGILLEYALSCIWAKLRGKPRPKMF